MVSKETAPPTPRPSNTQVARYVPKDIGNPFQSLEDEDDELLSELLDELS
jgi:hypothetical protein